MIKGSIQVICINDVTIPNNITGRKFEAGHWYYLSVDNKNNDIYVDNELAFTDYKNNAEFDKIFRKAMI